MIERMDLVINNTNKIICNNVNNNVCAGFELGEVV